MSSPGAAHTSAPTRIHGHCWRTTPRGTVELLASRCTKCGTSFLPSMFTCTECGNHEFSEAVLSPEGTLYSYTVVRGSGGVWPDVYAVAYVDYPEGVRVFGHLRREDLDRVSIGARVRTEEATLYTSRDGVPARCFRFYLESN